MVTSNHNTFSMPPSASGLHQAPSVISSRMTDIGSEDDDDINPKGAFTAFPALTGISSGKGLNDQNRPPSAKSSQTRPPTRPPPSRRGVAFGGSGGMWNTGRPTSTTSRSSKSHVPSLSSQAFFRPMSSQRLQARRNRPTEGGQLRATINRAEKVDSSTKDNADQNTDVLSPTGASEFLDLDDESRMEDTGSPIGATTLRSNEDSQRPLQNRALRNSILTHAGLGRSYKQAASSSTKPKTSVLYQATIVRPARGMASMPDNLRGHERTYPEKYFESAQGVQQDPPSIGANYQYFLGNTVFFGGGRLQNARDLPINLATGTLAVLPSVLFLYYSAPWLWHNVSPAIPIFFAYLFFICISSFIHASVSDPGILPRNIHPMPPAEPSADPLTLGPTTQKWVKVAGFHSPMDVPVKYCKTCNIWRPPRCHHCRVCDNCIETQDHHCVWLNNCVGRRNYRYFFIFVSTGTLLGLFLAFGSLGHLLSYQSMHKISFLQSLKVWRMTFAMFIYGLLATPYPASLWIYHLYLIGRAQTTREFLNSRMLAKRDRYLAFDQGSFLRNWIAIFLRARPPTYLQFKKKYTAGDQRFGTLVGRSSLPKEQTFELRNAGKGNRFFQGSRGG